MDSLTAESHAETLAKVVPLLEEGRHEEALPFFELHKSKGDDPIWSYLMALSLACLARGDEGLPHLEHVAKRPGFESAFGIPPEINNLAKTTALNHLMFETSVEALAVQPWNILRRYAELLNHKEFQAKAIVGQLKLQPENPEVVEHFHTVFEDAPPDQVIPLLDELVNSKPQACQPRALLGYFLQQRGKTALAIRHLKTAAENDPNAMEPHLYLGQIYSSQARFDDAEKELSEAFKKGKKPTVALLVELANCQRATYRYEEALQTLFQAFEIHPPSFRHWDQLVDTAQSTGNSQRLVEALRAAADRYPQDARLRQRFAMVAFRQGEPLAARDQLGATGIFQNPTKDPALARLASEISLALGDSATALHLVEILWKQSPNNPETCRLYGDALINDGRASEAEALLRETAKNNPNDRALQISWGRSLLALGDAERAHRAFGLACRLDPDDAEAMAEQGRAMLLLGLHDEAQNVLKESAKKVDPPLASTLVGLGSVYERKSLKDIARDFYRQALVRQSDRQEAAEGLLRTRPDPGNGTLAGDVLDLLSQLPSPFSGLRLWLALLRACFSQGAPYEARALKEKALPEVVRKLTPEYKAFLDSAEVRTLSDLSKELEALGEPEKAREIWRYAVSSPLAELSGRAASELKRLDTYEGPAAGGATAPSAPADEDPLASLLSATLPDTGESPLFATEAPRPPAAAPLSEEADLFLDESAPSPPPNDEVPLFSESLEEAVTPGSAGDDVLDALFALETPAPPAPEKEEESLFLDEPSQDPISSLLASTAPPASPPAEAALFVDEPASPTQDDESVFASEPVAPEVDESIFAPDPSSSPASLESGLFDLETPTPAAPLPQAPVSLEDSLFSLDDPLAETSTPETPTVAETPTETAAAETAPGAPTVVEEIVETPPVPEATPVPVQPAAEAGAPVATVPAAVTPPADPTPPAAEPSPSEPSQAAREELLPIPMAADFSPLTRRQLHYHEALASSGFGVVSSESLAHLLLQSAVGHEPPDPGSEQGTGSSTVLLQKALLSGAEELEKAEQFRGAARVLRTALLYQPESDDVLAALGRVQSRWASWLAGKHEYAHAVSLLRDSLQRRPDDETAAAQLETLYKDWMTWSAQSGDPAARDLLAVYLEQEKAALGGLRQEWEARKARGASVAAPAQAPPPVAPTMPPPAPVAESAPAAAAPTPAAATPAAAAATPAAAAPAAATPAAAAPAAATPAAAAPAAATPAAATPAAATPAAAAPAAAAPAAASPANPAAAVTAAPAAAAPPLESVSAPAQPAAQPAPVEQAVPAVSVAEAPPPVPEPAPVEEAAPLFDSKEEALETLDAAPDDESVAEGVFAIFADSLRDLTTVLKERANAQPEQPAWLLLLARAFRRSGAGPMAVIQYQKYIKVAPSPEAYEELAQTYEELGKEDFAKMTRRKAEKG